MGRPDGLGEHRSACHFAEPRTVVETVDVSHLEPDPRFATTAVDDSKIAAEEPLVAGEEPEGSAAAAPADRQPDGGAAVPPSPVTRLATDTDEHRPPSV